MQKVLTGIVLRDGSKYPKTNTVGWDATYQPNKQWYNVKFEGSYSRIGVPTVVSNCVYLEGEPTEHCTVIWDITESGFKVKVWDLTGGDEGVKIGSFSFVAVWQKL